MAAKPLTLYEKIWASHVVERRDDGTCLFHIDRHLVHEATSPQAFEDLRAAVAVTHGRRVADGRPALVVPESGPMKRQRRPKVRPYLHRGGLRMARAGLFDVLADKPRQGADGEALRVYLQTQFRRPAGSGARTHLLSPATVAAAGKGRLSGVRKLM